jgi:hypothetical protein
MSSIILVVEERSKVSLLRGLLRNLTDVSFRIFAAGRQMSQASLARNIIFHEGGPLMVVMDADTLDPSQARGACQLVETAIRNVSPDDRFAVFAFVPELEVIFFETPEVLLRKVGPECVNASIMDRGCLQPHASLQEILQRANMTQPSFFEELTNEDLDELRQGEQASKLIAAVERFIVGVGGSTSARVW